MILQQALRNRVSQKLSFCNYSFQEGKPFNGRKTIVIKRNSSTHRMQKIQSQKSTLTNVTKASSHRKSKTNIQNITYSHTSSILTSVLSDKSDHLLPKRQDVNKKFNNYLKFYESLKDNPVKGPENCNRRHISENYMNTKKIQKKSHHRQKYNSKYKEYKSVLKVLDNWKVYDMPQMFLICNEVYPTLSYKMYSSEDSRQKINIVEYHEKNKLHQIPLLVIVQLSTTKYCKIKLKSKINDEINTTRTKNKGQYIDFSSNKSLKQVLNFINNLNTDLQTNIFYCSIQPSSTHSINFFIINHPIRHHEKNYIKQIIYQFLLTNFQKICVSLRQSSDINLGYFDNCIMKNIHQEYYVLDSRGCISVLEQQAILDWFNNQGRSMSPRKEVSFGGNIRKKRSEKICQFIGNVQQYLNLDIRENNCLFEKSYE